MKRLKQIIKRKEDVCHVVNADVEKDKTTIPQKP